MKQHTIAIISCGGTITMEPGKKGALEPKKTIDQVIANLNLATFKNTISIPDELRVELLKLDSADVNHQHWIQMITTIEALQEKCDGILVLHGTDTLSYSATAVGLALAQKIKVPVIFTGSQSSLEQTGNDGLPNIERSLLVLKKAIQDGVLESMVFFGDKAFRGVNSRKRNEAEYNAFESPSIHPLYITTGLGIKKNFQGRTQKDIIHAQKSIPFPIKNAFADGVVVLTITPGLEAHTLLTLASHEATNALILNSLGAGNIPALPGKYNLIPALLTIIHELKKPVIVASPFVGGSTNMEVYLPGLLAKEAGVINAGKMTAEATAVKTRLLLAQPNLSFADLHKTLTLDFAGETAATDEHLIDL
ncbi:MAG TPA: asparaginase domain-containing protein [Patescibacteria group bacterium]|nr:asparaginase domain-containing protein [Patescibacteria group bacterium]